MRFLLALIILMTFAKSAHAITLRDLDRKIQEMDFSTEPKRNTLKEIHALSRQFRALPEKGFASYRQMGIDLASLYVDAHYMQDAIWFLQKVEADSVAERLKNKVMNYILSAKPMGIIAVGNPRDTYLFDYPGGISGIYKDPGFYDNPKPEVGVYELSEVLGFHLVPVTFPFLHLRKEDPSHNEIGSMQLFVREMQNGNVNFRDVKYNSDFAELYALDVISENKDRNSGNWLKRPMSGIKLVAIDNGVSYGGDGYVGHLAMEGSLRLKDTPPQILFGTPALKKLTSISDDDLRWALLKRGVDEKIVDFYVRQRSKLLLRLDINPDEIVTTSEVRRRLRLKRPESSTFMCSSILKLGA